MIVRELRDPTIASLGCVVGTSTNLGALLGAATEPGGILVSRETQGLLRKNFALDGYLVGDVGPSRVLSTKLSRCSSMSIATGQ